MNALIYHCMIMQHLVFGLNQIVWVSLYCILLFTEIILLPAINMLLSYIT